MHGEKPVLKIFYHGRTRVSSGAGEDAKLDSENCGFEQEINN